MPDAITLREKVASAFDHEFPGAMPQVVRAPGRVNLIGEHTDYNGGFVFPMAINRAVWIAFRPRTDSIVRVKSLDFSNTMEFDLAAFAKAEPTWIEYIKGVASALRDRNHALKGWEGVLASDVPIGAGLSSSAALELATARVFAAVSGFAWDPPQMALAGQAAENQWVGVNCGIMDQMISACGVAEHALLIDCRSLEYTPAPLPPETSIVILDTATRRGLDGTPYNERRAQCEEAARFFGVPQLRDVSIEQFKLRENNLADLPRRRARHIITENDRTVRAATCLRQWDAAGFGSLMDESHLSMRSDFEISSPALDTMVEIARATPGCLGARMTGGGFGGCAVALVQTAAAEDFSVHVAAAYQAATQLKPEVYICHATAGAELFARP